MDCSLTGCFAHGISQAQKLKWVAMSLFAADQPIPTGGRGEVGASQSQNEANSTPEASSSTKLQTGFQFLTKDFLRFWVVDIRREGRSQRSAPQKRHKVPRNRRGQGGEKSHCT